MMDYLKLEWRLATRVWTWLLFLLFAILRAVGVVGPSEGWRLFLSAAYPLIIAFAAIHVLDQEKRWRTRSVLRATQASTHAVLSVRFFMLSAPLLGLPFLIVSPRAAIDLIAAAVILASVSLTMGNIVGIEWAAGGALAWWSISFLVLVPSASPGSVFIQWISIIATPRALPSGGLDLINPAVKLAGAILLLILPGCVRRRAGPI